MRRRILVLLFCVFGLAAAAHTACWLWATHALAEGYEAWAAARRSEGWTVGGGPASRGGWPLHASLTLPDAALRASVDGLPDALAWRADRVTLQIGLPDPHRLLVIPGGEQRLRLANGPDIVCSAGALTASLPLGASRLSRMDLRGENVRLSLPGLAGPVAVASLQAEAGWPDGGGTVSLVLDTAGIVLPPEMRPPLGDRITALSLQAAVTGVAAAGGGLREQVAGWREGGGRIDIGRLSLAWGPLALSGKATLSLDERLQPAASGVVHLAGYAEAADTLATNGAVTRSEAAAAKAVLALLARFPEDGGAAEVELPVTLRDRTLAVRDFRLARLPLLAWPGGQQ